MNLNEIESSVLNAAVLLAKRTGDNGTEFCFDELNVPGLNESQLKGYISQLVQKGYIEKMVGCYFDLEIVRTR